MHEPFSKFGLWSAVYCFIRDADHLTNVTRYIEQNPVKAELCGEASDWRWSSVGRKLEC